MNRRRLTVWASVAAFAAAVGGSAVMAGGASAKQAPASTTANTLRIAIGADPIGFNPATVLQNEAGFVMTTMYDGLTEYEPGTTTVTAGLATSWKITNGGKTYTFQLRKNVKFSDGSPMNAQAIGAWIDSEINPKDADYYAKEKNISSFVSFTWGTVTGYKILGTYTIQVNMKSPNAEFLADLGMAWNGVPSAQALQQYGTDLWEHPVGTGPYELVQWKKGQYVELQANPDYWGKKPNIQYLFFQVIPDFNVQLLSLRTGAVQIMANVTPQQVPTIKKTPGEKLLYQPGLVVNGVALPTQTGPFKSKLVRQALNYAVNKRAMDKTLYGGLATPMSSPLPPVISQFDKSLKAYPYDPQKAKQLLKQAGYPNGFSATLYAYSNSRGYNPAGGPQMATAIQGYLAKIGVKITIDSIDFTTFLTTVRSNKFNDMTLVGWSGDNGDPDDMISPLFNGNAFGTGNFAHYNNPTVNKLFAEGIATANPAQRTKIYDQVQKTIMQDAPWIFVNYATQVRAESTRVHGFQLDPLEMFYNMNTVSLSK